MQADAARKLADLMRDRGIVTAGSSHDFLTQTLAKYFSQGSTQQMVGRGNARQAPAAPGAPQGWSAWEHGRLAGSRSC